MDYKKQFVYIATLRENSMFFFLVKKAPTLTANKIFNFLRHSLH